MGSSIAASLQLGGTQAHADLPLLPKHAKDISITSNNLCQHAAGSDPTVSEGLVVIQQPRQMAMQLVDGVGLLAVCMLRWPHDICMMQPLLSMQLAGLTQHSLS